MKSKHAKWGLVQLLTIVMVVAAGTAFAAGEALLHNSDNLGTKYGNWGVAGGTYGEFSCTTCHNKTTNNVKRVVGSIPNTIGPNVNKPVVFNNMTAFGDDSAGHATSFRICEVCHTQTTYHQYNTANAPQSGNLTHPNGNCTQCHSHADGFKASGCTGCHGHNAGSDTPIVTGKHAEHINNTAALGVNLSCAACHAPTMSSDTVFSNVANHNPNNYQTATPGGPDVNYGGTSAGAYAAGTCTSYCHTNGKSGAAAVAVTWNGAMTLDCKGCHGGGSSQAGEPVYASGAAGSATANNHPIHVGTSGANATCQNCHGATMSGTGLNASGQHTDQTIDVVQGNGKTFTYTDATKTCSNISCHSSNGIVSGVAAAQWGANLNCDGCHAMGAIATGGHQSHLTHAGITCANCHYSTTTDSATITGSTHIDGAVSLQQGGSFNSQAVIFTPAGAGCNNISCHGGSSVSDWNAQATCETCHPKANLSGHHSMHMGALNLTDSAIMYNMTANRTPVQTDAVLTHGFGCANCHPLNASNHLNGSVDVDMSSKNVAGTSSIRFLNSTTTGKLPTYSGGTCSNIYCHSNASRVTAELVYKPTPTWVGGSFTGDRCAACHDNQPATGAHAAHAVGNHTDNIYNGKSGKLATSSRANTAHGNPNNSTTIGCYICHQATVTSKANDKNTKCIVCHNGTQASLKGNASISNLKSHVNGSREILFPAIKVLSKAQIRPESFKFYSSAWVRTTYKSYSTLSFDTAKLALDTDSMWHPSTPMQSSCTNIACHNLTNKFVAYSTANGKGIGPKPVFWNLANWNDPNKCMDCHNQL